MKMSEIDRIKIYSSLIRQLTETKASPDIIHALELRLEEALAEKESEE